MKLWIARTPNNGLYLFLNKPFWRQDWKLWCEWIRWTKESDRLFNGYIFDSDLEENPKLKEKYSPYVCSVCGQWHIGHFHKKK